MTYSPQVPTTAANSQVWFVGPEGMQLTWDVTMPGAFDSQPMIVPGRTNFAQGAIYRVKLTNIPGRPGVELYPTLEIAPTIHRTAAFIAHNAIPVQFTPEDFDQVLSGNFVTKVIYLPDPEFQELAAAGVDTLVSTRLDPGVDPIIEADRKGAILAIVRVGNKDFGGGAGAGVGMVPAVAGPGGPMPVAYVAGGNAPQWGMPMSGTPIGLPGPPHVPFGAPAGLQKHTMVNHTRMHIPGPTNHVRIDVKQKPGLSYPKPANHVSIRERTGGGWLKYEQPLGNRHQAVTGPGGACPDAPCPQGQAPGAAEAGE
jgi:hypothetical protein